MSGSEIYNPPKAKLDSDETPNANKSSALIIFFSIILTIFLMAPQILIQYGNAGLPGGIGGAIGSLMPALFVVLLFQIGKRFRNSKSRWKIFMWSQFVILLGQVTAFIQFIGKNA